MSDNEDGGPLYSVEKAAVGWRVIGPNGTVGDFDDEAIAQRTADNLNAEVAEEREDDA